jgi:hypothetical protein
MTWYEAISTYSLYIKWTRVDLWGTKGRPLYLAYEMRTDGVSEELYVMCVKHADFSKRAFYGVLFFGFKIEEQKN